MHFRINPRLYSVSSFYYSDIEKKSIDSTETEEYEQQRRRKRKRNRIHDGDKCDTSSGAGPSALIRTPSHRFKRTVFLP